MEIEVKKIIDDNEKQQYVPKNLLLWGTLDNSISEKTFENDYWAAFIGDKFVGCIIGAIEYWGSNNDDYYKNHTLHHLDATEHCNGRLYACFVNDDYRGKGIGKLLFSKMEEYFKSNDCKYIIGIQDDPFWDDDSEQKKFLRSVGFVNLTRSYTINRYFNYDSDMTFTIMAKYIGD